MRHRIGIVGLLLALGLACSVYALKDRVQRLERQLESVRATIVAEQAVLERLGTEWAMLNQPSRIARLAEQHLNLVPAKPRQIMTIADIPRRSELLLARRSWQAELPSGGTATLRFKPHDPAGLSLLTAVIAEGQSTRGDR